MFEGQKCLIKWEREKGRGGEDREREERGRAERDLFERQEALVEGENGLFDFFVGVFKAREGDGDVVGPLHV